MTDAKPLFQNSTEIEERRAIAVAFDAASSCPCVHCAEPCPTSSAVPVRARLLPAQQRRGVVQVLPGSL